LGDRAKIALTPCSCGRTWRCIELLGCRSHQILITPDGKQFDASIFHEILNHICIGPVAAYITNFKIIQKSSNLIRVFIEKGQMFAQHEQALKEAFIKQVHTKIHSGIKVNFLPFQIEQKRKHSYFESLVSKNDLNSVKMGETSIYAQIRR
jgi:phenylacetate-coenzyme A ligase PaaK-like adenylate-forming protein